jgi:AcrR family transcriptional regulator
MPRPVVIRDNAILRAARDLFLRHGYGASTAAIARRAGVSEGSVFKRYRTKNGLFLAAMEVEGRENAWEGLLAGAAGRGDVRRTLEEAGRRLLRRLEILTPRIIAVRASGLTLPTGYRRRRRPPPVVHIETLARYFREETRLGRLRTASPQALAHVFVGALAHYAFCETVFRYRSAPPAVFVRQVVAAVLAAAAASPSPENAP